MTTAPSPQLSVRRLTLGAFANAGAAAVASVAGLAIVLLAGRSMEPSEYASFASVWGLVFGWAAILGALEQENARVRSAFPGPIDRTQLQSTAIVASGSAAVMTLVVVVFFDELHLKSMLVASLIVLSAAVFPTMFTARGYLAGSLRFGTLSAVTAGEALLRLLVVVVGLVAALSALPVFAVAALAGACVGVPVLARHATSKHGPVSLGSTLKRTTTLMLGNAMSAAMVTGAPVLVTLAMVSAPEVDVGRMQAAVVVSRFPLIGLMLLQSLLVPVFTRRASLFVGSDYRRVVLTLVVAVPCLGLLSLVGAVPLLVALFGDQYSVEPSQIALLTTGATALGCLQILVALAISGDRHRLAPMTFGPSLLVSVLLLLTPLVGLDMRVPVALAVGPVVGLMIALALTSRWRRHKSQSCLEPD